MKEAYVNETKWFSAEWEEKLAFLRAASISPFVCYCKHDVGAFPPGSRRAN